MRYFALLVVLVVLVSLSLTEAEPEANTRSLANARARFELPRLFDFARFKELFEKHYDSLLENLARKKIFLARAFKAMISGVAYKYKRSDSYLAINHMSDWTQPEVDRLLRRKRPIKDAANQAVVEESELAEKLAEIREGKAEAGLSEIAHELNELSTSRHKRSVKGAVRDLSLDDLMKPKVENEMTMSDVDEPSDNPDFEPPELDSFGVEGETKDRKMGETLAKSIVKLPGVKYLNSMLSRAKHIFSPKSDRVELKSESFEESDSEDEDDDTSDEDEDEDEDEDDDEISEGEDEVFVDYRDSKCLSEPRNQGGCGSCYIFSVMALYEWMHCEQRGKLLLFSEQFNLDCGHLAGLEGCEGGSESDVARFVQHYGLQLLHNYPYAEAVHTCPYAPHVSARAMGYKRPEEKGLYFIPVKDFADMLNYQSPFLIGVKATDEFLQYGGGVDKLKGCRKTGEDHSMLMVGHGRQDGREYWLIRNSYGPNWGENGYYKLDKRSDCFSDNRQGQVSEASFGHRNPNFINAFGPHRDRKPADRPS